MNANIIVLGQCNCCVAPHKHKSMKFRCVCPGQEYGLYLVAATIKVLKLRNCNFCHCDLKELFAAVASFYFNLTLSILYLDSQYPDCWDGTHWNCVQTPSISTFL